MEKKNKIIVFHIYTKGRIYCFKSPKLLKGNELGTVIKIGTLHTEISEQVKSSGMSGDEYCYGTALQSLLPNKTSMGKFSCLEAMIAH